MLSDYFRVRSLLNLNATSVKAITSFIIAKTSWNTLPVLQRATEIRSYKLNCLRSSSYVSSKCTSGQCKIRRSTDITLLHMLSIAEPSRTIDNNKKIESKATPPLLAIHASDSSKVNKSCFWLRLYSSTTATARERHAELCRIADRKQTSYPRNLWKHLV